RHPGAGPPLAAFAAGVAGQGGPLNVVASWLASKPTGASLPIDNDLSRRPHKHFVADNTTPNREAIRLMVLEWDRPLLPRNGEVRVGLRFHDNPLSPTLGRPQVRVSWSPYRPSNPTFRLWEPLPVRGWDNGELRFRAPDVNFRFVVIRVQLHDAADASESSPLMGEIHGCVV